jgi:uncharacterized membrane protein
VKPMLLLLLALGCATDGKPADSGPADNAGAHDSGEVDWASLSCDEAPVVTYANFGQGFITHYCQGCHASASAHRYGAPDDVTFDNLEEVWTWDGRILIRASGAEEADMPPAGGTGADDRQKLRWWLECAEAGT